MFFETNANAKLNWVNLLSIPTANPLKQLSINIHVPFKISPTLELTSNLKFLPVV